MAAYVRGMQNPQVGATLPLRTRPSRRFVSARGFVILTNGRSSVRVDACTAHVDEMSLVSAGSFPTGPAPSSNTSTS